MSDFEKLVEIRNKLRRTWQPFFSRFGSLTPVQILTIPLILSGQNALICAPTATGKTEAVVGPISELILENGNESLACVYVSPTRALVNDLAERLSEPLAEVNLSLGIWTGDHHSFNARSPDSFLLTTPESLDSTLCRFPECFRKVRFAVFDELHLIDGTCRGDQLIILIKRLQALTGSLRLYGMSATIKKPEEVINRYLGKAVCVKVIGGREIIERIVDGSKLDAGLSEIVEAFMKERMSKALFFCNSRAKAEQICLKLQTYFEEDRVLVHHGSLPRDRREAAERAFKEKEFCFCVATMTLEVGIDIGNIDAVVLVGAPPSVSSLLQRIGRGSRRKPYTTVIGLAESVEEEATFRGLFNLAKKGELEDVVWHPCYSVAVQQALSISFQGRMQGIPSERMSGFFESLGLSNDDALNIILRLRENGYLLIQRGLIYPSQKTLDLANRGLIHSNIGTDKGYQVVDSATGEKLGEIGYVDTNLDSFVLGGKLWKVLGTKGSDVLVKKGKEQAGTLSFVRRGRKGAFYHLLPSTLKEKSSC